MDEMGEIGSGEKMGVLVGQVVCGAGGWWVMGGMWWLGDGGWFTCSD